MNFSTKTGCRSVVDQPTRGSSLLDKIYVSESCYEHIEVVDCSVKSDHKAIFAYNGNIKTTSKTAKVYRKVTPAEHASFCRMLSRLSRLCSQYDRWCSTGVWPLLRYSLGSTWSVDRFYSERTIVITSANSPEFVTPAVKAMLWRKNRLMRRGRIDEADVLACRIGRAIIRYNSVELSRVDPKIRVQCGLKLGNSLDAAAPSHRVHRV